MISKKKINSHFKHLQLKLDDICLTLKNIYEVIYSKSKSNIFIFFGKKLNKYGSVLFGGFGPFCTVKTICSVKRR